MRVLPSLDRGAEPRELHGFTMFDPGCQNGLMSSTFHLSVGPNQHHQHPVLSDLHGILGRRLLAGEQHLVDVDEHPGPLVVDLAAQVGPRTRALVIASFCVAIARLVLSNVSV